MNVRYIILSALKYYRIHSFYFWNAAVIKLVFSKWQLTQRKSKVLGTITLLGNSPLEIGNRTSNNVFDMFLVIGPGGTCLCQLIRSSLIRLMICVREMHVEKLSYKCKQFCWIPKELNGETQRVTPYDPSHGTLVYFERVNFRPPNTTRYIHNNIKTSYVVKLQLYHAWSMMKL